MFSPQTVMPYIKAVTSMYKTCPGFGLFPKHILWILKTKKEYTFKKERKGNANENEVIFFDCLCDLSFDGIVYFRTHTHTHTQTH